MTLTPTNTSLVADLRNLVRGQVIAPDDPDYDRARTVFLGGIDRRPAAIVRVADAEDVARVVGYVRDAALELAVRSGGHSSAGHGVSEGGVVIDLAALRSLDIDVEGRTAWAGTGLTAGEYTAAVGEHGLATGFGDTGSVGIGGITLAGGIGFLARKHGLTVDDVLGAEVVTADGVVRHVDAETEPDLFWAIRGGGGNFGVVTRVNLRLHEVGTVTGGMLILPATPQVVAGFIALAEAAPEELTTIANVMAAPPMPFIPPEVHGTTVLMALVVHAGDVAEGERVLAPFRALATPIVDMVRAMPYTGMYPPEEEFHPTAVSRTMFLDHVDEALAARIIERIDSSDAVMRVVQLRVLGGAMAGVPADATAFAHRTARLMANVAAFYNGPDDLPARKAWVEGLMAELRQGHDGAYVGFLADEGESRVQAAYPPATWERLAAVKRQYDPGNLFRLNQNIPPATATGSATAPA